MPAGIRTALIVYSTGVVAVFITVALFFALGCRKPNPKKNPEEYQEWKYMAPEEREDWRMARMIGIFMLAPLSAVAWPAFPFLILAVWLHDKYEERNDDQ